MKTYRNILATSLAVILVSYFVIFGAENYWKVLLTHFMFLALFPLFIFIHIFSKKVPLKDNLSIQAICTKVLLGKCKINPTLIVFLLLFLSGTDFVFDGIDGFINGWLTWWSFAAAGWLILLTSYSYQVYINPSNKSDEPIKNPPADS